MSQSKQKTFTGAQTHVLWSLQLLYAGPPAKFLFLVLMEVGFSKKTPNKQENNTQVTPCLPYFIKPKHIVLHFTYSLSNCFLYTVISLLRLNMFYKRHTASHSHEVQSYLVDITSVSLLVFVSSVVVLLVGSRLLPLTCLSCTVPIM